MTVSTRTFAFSIIALFIALAAHAHDGDDTRPLDHSDYDRWNSLAGYELSPDGVWVHYSVRNGKDQSTLFIRQTQSDRQYSIPHATGARFSDDSQFAIYRILPDPDLVKKLRKAKTKPEEMPRPKLEILHLESGRHATIDDVQSFRMPGKGAGWVAFLMNREREQKTVQAGKASVGETFEVTPEGLKRPGTEPTKPEKKKPEKATGKSSGESKATEAESKPEQSPGSEKKSDEQKKKPAGTTLVLRELDTGFERRFPNVINYAFDESGKVLAFCSSAEDDSDPQADGVWVVDLEKGSLQQILEGLGNYRQLSVNKQGDMVAFVTDRDDYAAKHPSWSLYLWRSRQKQAQKIADEETRGVPEGWWVSSTGRIVFSDDGRRVYFDTQPKPEDLDEDDEDEEPKAVLDLWHWQDPMLQPQQLLQAEQERRRGYRAVYDVRSRKVIQLATKDMPMVAVDPRSSSDFAVGVSREKYNKLMSWDMPGFTDSYLVDLKTGEAEMILEASRQSAQLSPGGQYLYWWDTDSRHWMAMPTRSADGKRKPVAISRAIKHPLFNELHDTPSDPPPYGVALWLEGDKAVWIYDRFDIWQLDPTGKSRPVCVTGDQGRNQSIRFRVARLDPEFRALGINQPIWLSAFNEATKASGFWRMDRGDDVELSSLIMLDERIRGLEKARDADTVVFTRETFRRCPDLWTSTLDLASIRRLSRINPQQHEYSWGTAELVHWKSAKGEPLDGILYKPDGFDPDKKYPMMVYFYERNSDNLHAYHTPAAGRSIINFSFYVSRGYLLFVPDIPYRTGFPGPSCADAVLPGVKSLVKQGFVDEARIGMQGHSWGGYQTAYLVTQTDMFACAESGAPVSNMTSAYGGIRWGSGMSRMFQYERTQSRIGETLWEAPEKYIANSPLFHADKINTPLLILHNDQDGAVPWYQGIELFVALRRLEKPCWLLNYNGEPHWVMKRENRLDFARRMQQFFDHYLKDAPMPEWMAHGIPAVEKGKKFGFEPAELEPDTEPAENKN